MFATPFLRSAVSLSGQAAKVQAPKHIRLSITKSNLRHFGSLYLSKFPNALQWGALLGAVLLWPIPAIKLIEATGGINPRVRSQGL